MTFASFLMALALAGVAWVRALIVIARHRPWLALPGLLCPPLIAWIARRHRLDLSFELSLLGTALTCLLPSLFYFGVILR